MLRPVLLFLFFASAAAAQPATVAGSLEGVESARFLAHVHVLSPGADRPSATAAVGADGHFEIETDLADRFVTLRFAGLHRRSLDVTLFLDAGERVDLAVRLAPVALAEDFSVARLEGDFPSAGRRLRPQPDGTLALTFAPRADTLAYQVVDVSDGGFPIAGTAFDRVALDAEGGYVTVLDTPGDSVTVVFDPAKLPRSGASPSIDFADPASLASRTAAVLQNLDARSRRVFAERHRVFAATKGRPVAERQAALDSAMVTFDLHEEVARLAAALVAETDATLRQALLLNYVSVETDAEAKDPALGVAALREIGPENPLWGLYPPLIQLALDLASHADSAATASALRTVTLEHPSPAVRAYALLYGLADADERGDEGAAQGFYTLLKADEYADTDPAVIAGLVYASYDPDGAVAVGALVPDFSLPLMDTGGTVSRQSLLGTTYLLDLWAVWCAPCIDEMPTLHAAYERFRDEEFEIVSLSFDDSPDQVRTFREAHFPMPWKHVFVESGLTGEFARRFEVRGLPMPILVGPDGRILALSSAKLRGAFLEQTLEAHFAETAE